MSVPNYPIEDRQGLVLARWNIGQKKVPIKAWEAQPARKSENYFFEDAGWGLIPPSGPTSG
jgi:hypothetical protein